MVDRNVLPVLVDARRKDKVKRCCRNHFEKQLLSMRRRSLSRICPTVWIVDGKVRRRGRKPPPSCTRYGISATQWFRRFSYISGRANPQFQHSSVNQLARRPKKKRRRVVEDNSDEDLPAASSSSQLEEGLYCLPDIAAAIVKAQEEEREEMRMTKNFFLLNNAYRMCY